MAQAGVAPRDPQAARLAAVLPGITEEAIALYFPLVLPTSISTLGLLLIAAGAHQPHRPKAVRGKGKKRKRRPRPRKSSQPSQKRASNVLPMRKRAWCPYKPSEITEGFLFKFAHLGRDPPKLSAAALKLPQTPLSPQSPRFSQQPRDYDGGGNLVDQNEIRPEC